MDFNFIEWIDYGSGRTRKTKLLPNQMKIVVSNDTSKTRYAYISMSREISEETRLMTKCRVGNIGSKLAFQLFHDGEGLTYSDNFNGRDPNSYTKRIASRKFIDDILNRFGIQDGKKSYIFNLSTFGENVYVINDEAK